MPGSTTDVGIRIVAEGEREFRNALSASTSQIRNLEAELRAVNSSFYGMENSEEAVAARTQVMNRLMDATRQKISILGTQYDRARGQLDTLARELEQATQRFGANSREAREAQDAYNRQARRVNELGRQLNDARNSLNRMENDMRDARRSTDNLSDGLDDAAKEANSFSDAFSGAFLGGVVVGAVQALAGAVGNLVSETEEYRKIMGTLEVSSQKAGYTAQETAETYRQLYQVLGDEQTAATTVANLQALGLSQQELTQLTNGAIGAWATYGDSIPIDGLAEAINETAKVGTVTGTFADVLNWAGTSEDAFNEKLAAAGDESARAALIMEELTNQGLIPMAETWRETNADIVASRDATASLNDTMAQFGEVLSPIATEGKEAFNDLLQGILGIYNAFSEGGMEEGMNQIGEFLSGIGEEVANAIPNIIFTFSTLIPQLATALQNAIPQVLTTLTGLFGQMSEYMKQNLPTFIANGVAALASFSAGLRENVGILVDSALELVKSLGNGIIESLPALIENVPTIVTNIAGIINDNAPKLIATAAELIWNLIKGLIGSISTIVENIPKIIEAIVSVFMAFNWVGLGKNVIMALKNGLTAAIGAVKTAGQNIFNAVINGIKALPSRLLQFGQQGSTMLINGIRTFISNIGPTLLRIKDAILQGLASLPNSLLNLGKQLIEGLWQGISDMGSWIGEKIRGFGQGVLDDIQEFFGINSPSRLMKEEVGVMITRGIAVGMEDGISYTKKAAKRVGTALEKAISEVNNKIAKMGEEAQKEQAAQELEEYKKSIKEKYTELEKAEVDGRQQILDEIAQMEAEWNDKQVQAAEDAAKESLNAQLEALEDFQQEYESAVSEIEKSQESMAEKLMDYGELFQEVKDDTGTFLELGDLQADIDKITQYGNALEALKARGISDSLMDEVTGMDVDDAIAYTQQLLNMTDEQYETYMELWEKKQQEAKKVAEKFYQSEFDSLEKEFIDKLPAELSVLKQDMQGLGVNSAQGLANGFASQYGYIKSVFVDTISSALEAAKEAMGVHSPSTVWAGFGENLADGLGVGFVEEMKSVTDDIIGAIPRGTDAATNSSLLKAAEATVNGMAVNNQPYAQPIILQVQLDKRTIAETIFDPLKNVSRQRGVVLG